MSADDDFDEEALQALRDDLGPALGEFVSQFLSSLQETLGEMRAALDDRRLADLAAGAHRLKGTAGYVGAARLMATLGELQQMASDGGERSRMAELIERAESLAARARARLEPVVGA